MGFPIAFLSNKEAADTRMMARLPPRSRCPLKAWCGTITYSRGQYMQAARELITRSKRTAAGSCDDSDISWTALLPSISSPRTEPDRHMHCRRTRRDQRGTAVGCLTCIRSLFILSALTTRARKKTMRNTCSHGSLRLLSPFAHYVLPPSALRLLIQTPGCALSRTLARSLIDIRRRRRGVYTSCWK